MTMQTARLYISFLQPRLIYSLLHQKVSCICLGDEFTVVITGDGCSGNVNPLVLDSGSTRLHEWQDEYDTDLMEKEKEKDEEKDQEKDEGSDGNQKVETEDQNGTINPTDQNFLHPSS